MMLDLSMNFFIYVVRNLLIIMKYLINPIENKHSYCAFLKTLVLHNNPAYFYLSQYLPLIKIK